MIIITILDVIKTVNETIHQIQQFSFCQGHSQHQFKMVHFGNKQELTTY